MPKALKKRATFDTMMQEVSKYLNISQLYIYIILYAQYISIYANYLQTIQEKEAVPEAQKDSAQQRQDLESQEAALHKLSQGLAVLEQEFDRMEDIHLHCMCNQFSFFSPRAKIIACLV